MNKKTPYSGLFTTSGCLSREGLSKYVEGKLNKRDIHIVEMHTLECQLCSDAIEGFSSVNKNHRTKMLRNIDPLLVNTKKNFPRWIVYSSVAAALGIIITSAILTTNFNKIINKETALNKNETTTEDILPNASAEDTQNQELALINTINKKGPEKKGFAETVILKDQEEYPVMGGTYFRKETEDEKKPDANTRNTDSVTDISKPIKATGVATDQDDSGGEVVDKLSLSQTVSGKEEDVTTASEKKGLKRSKNKSDGKKSIVQKPGAGDYKLEEKQIEDLNSVYENGLSLFNASKYEEAIIKFEYLIKMNFQNCDAKYYCALSYYNINNSRSALKQLDNLTKDNKNQCYEKARFQKAIILSNTGKKSESDKIFKKIIEENGSFKDEAEKELNKN
jgi:tetratricopeptide (TPR) repeat protein